MEDNPDDFCLERIAQSHKIAAGMFIPFAVARLLDNPNSPEALLTVKLRGIRQEGEAQRSLRLWWAEENNRLPLFGVQDKTITEWAALGVACVMVSAYAGLWVQEVARQGDGFDFWVTDGEQEWPLEVSGTMTDDVETRHRVKLAQLRTNPYQVDGYVVVVGFTTRTVIFSFNPFAGGNA